MWECEDKVRDGDKGGNGLRAGFLVGGSNEKIFLVIASSWARSVARCSSGGEKRGLWWVISVDNCRILALSLDGAGEKVLVVITPRFLFRF